MSMDILAWLILAVAASTIILPVIAALMSSDPFITYREAWAVGHLILFFGLCLLAVIGGILWAAERVLW